MPPGYGTTIWPAWRCPARTRWKAPSGRRLAIPGKWQSRIRRSVDSSIDVRRARLAAGVGARIDADDLDSASSHGALDRLVAQQRRLPESRRARRGRRVARTGRDCRRSRGCRGRRSRRPSSRSTRSSSGTPERRETRSPVMQTRSGFRSTTHSTASRTARRPRDGTPRWRSERCAIRSPSSSAGRPSTRTPTTRLSQPAGLEPRPGRDRRARGEHDDEQPDQTESFSVTGSTETT